MTSPPPVLILGAVAAVAVGSGLAPFGPASAAYVINVALALVFASFLVEPIWGKYRAH